MAISNSLYICYRNKNVYQCVCVCVCVRVRACLFIHISVHPNALLSITGMSSCSLRTNFVSLHFQITFLCLWDKCLKCCITSRFIAQRLTIKEREEDARISGRGQSWLPQPWSCSPLVGRENNVANKATCVAKVSEYFLPVSRRAAPRASRVTSDHSPAPSALSNLWQPCHMTSWQTSSLAPTLDWTDLRWCAGCVVMQKQRNHTNSTEGESEISALLLLSSTNTYTV